MEGGGFSHVRQGEAREVGPENRYDSLRVADWETGKLSSWFCRGFAWVLAAAATVQSSMWDIINMLKREWTAPGCSLFTTILKRDWTTPGWSLLLLN